MASYRCQPQKESVEKKITDSGDLIFCIPVLEEKYVLKSFFL